MEIACCLILIAAAFTLMMCFDNSSAARSGVALLLDLGLLGLILHLLPHEVREQLPGSGYLRRNPYAYAAIALGYALCYPLVARLLYPLRDRFMAALERHFHRKG